MWHYLVIMRPAESWVQTTGDEGLFNPDSRKSEEKTGMGPWSVQKLGPDYLVM